MTKKTKATKMLNSYGMDVLTFNWTENHEHKFNGITISIDDEDDGYRLVNIIDERHDPEIRDWTIKGYATYWKSATGKMLHEKTAELTRKELTQIFEVIDFLEK